MDFGKELFDPFTKGFARLRDHPYFLNAMEIANEVKALASNEVKALASDGALQKCVQAGAKKIAKESLDLGQKYLLCGKRKKENKGKSCDQSLTGDDKIFFGLVDDIVTEGKKELIKKTNKQIDDYFEEAMGNI